MTFDLDIRNFSSAGHYVKFEGQSHMLTFKVTEGKQGFSDCSNGQPWQKSRRELETVNK